MMTQTDTRPPLYLTPSEAKNWFSLHSEDIGREVVVREWMPIPLPPEYLEAWRGFGQWFTGVTGGAWPEKTLFDRQTLTSPPHGMAVGGGGCVWIAGAGGYACYTLDEPGHPTVLEFERQAGRDTYVGVRFRPGVRLR